MIFSSSTSSTACLTGITSSNGASLPVDDKPLICSGDTLHGKVDLSEYKHVESVTIEFAGWLYVAVLQVDLQPTSTVMTLGGGDALTGSALRGPSTHRAATRLFSSVKQLYTPPNGEKEVEFDFKMPEVDVRRKGLPVSLHLGKIKASSLPSRGFCRYQVTVVVKGKGRLGMSKTDTQIIPLLYLPHSPSSSPPTIPSISSLISRTQPNQIPSVPEKWNVEECEEMLKSKEAGLGGLFRSNSRNEPSSGGGTSLRVKFATPRLDGWPTGRAVPYYLLVQLGARAGTGLPSYTSSEDPSPAYASTSYPSSTPAHTHKTSPVSLSRIELNFLVSRWIEKQTQTGTARQFVHETTKSGEKGEEGTRFEVTKDGIWVDDGAAAGGEGKTLVQMGTMRILGLPSFDNDILRLIYVLGVHIKFPSDSSFTQKDRPVELMKPRITTAYYPHSDDGDDRQTRAEAGKELSKLLCKDYWSLKEDFAEFGSPSSGQRAVTGSA